MPIAGRISIDGTVKPSEAKGVVVWAATQADAERGLALLLEASGAPEAPASHSQTLTLGQRSGRIFHLPRRGPYIECDDHSIHCTFKFSNSNETGHDNLLSRLIIVAQSAWSVNYIIAFFFPESNVIKGLRAISAHKFFSRALLPPEPPIPATEPRQQWGYVVRTNIKNIPSALSTNLSSGWGVTSNSHHASRLRRLRRARRGRACYPSRPNAEGDGLQ